MSGLYELTAEIRSDMGRGASRRLRRKEDKIPAIMYGAGKEPTALHFDHKSVMKALENEGFYSHILTLHISGQKQQAVLKDLQRHPYKPRILHMDFLRISATEKITMHVPLHFKGGDVAPGVKDSGGIVSHLMTSVDVRCLPADLPEYLEVDISQLNLDESIHLSHVKLPKGVEILALTHGEDLPIANIHIPRAVIEEVPVAEVPTEGEAEEAAAAGTEKAEEPAKPESK